jgi:hypothetical protein
MLLKQDRPACGCYSPRLCPAAFSAGSLGERGCVGLIVTYIGKEREIVDLEQALPNRRVAVEPLIGAGIRRVAVIQGIQP